MFCLCFLFRFHLFQKGDTALTLAARQGHFDIIKYLCTARTISEEAKDVEVGNPCMLYYDG